MNIEKGQIRMLAYYGWNTIKKQSRNDLMYTKEEYQKLSS